MRLTAIFVLLGEPFDVPTEQYQFHSESIISDEKVALEKELVRMLKPEDPSDHMNWETPEANGYGITGPSTSLTCPKQLFQQLQTVQFGPAGHDCNGDLRRAFSKKIVSRWRRWLT